MPNQTGIAGDDFYDLLEANRTLTRRKKLGTPGYPLRAILSYSLSGQNIKSKLLPSYAQA